MVSPVLVILELHVWTRLASKSHRSFFLPLLIASSVSPCLLDTGSQESELALNADPSASSQVLELYRPLSLTYLFFPVECVGCRRTTAHMRRLRGQLGVVGSLLFLCGFWESNAGQACKADFPLTKPSHQLPFLPL